jgi:polyisoprenoid-binding protein YceI
MSFVTRYFGIASLSLALLASASSPASAAEAPEWAIDPAHSTISFSVRHIMSQVQGTFDRFSGSVRFDPENLAGSRLSIEIPIASVNTRNTQRDGHLQTADFFDAATYPNMRFVGDTFVRTGENRYSVVGRLTIKNVTRRVALPFEFRGVVDHPMKRDHVVTGTRIALGVLRSDYGVGTGSYAETAMIGDEVSIVIDIEALRPKATATATTRPAARPAAIPASQPAQ